MFMWYCVMLMCMFEIDFMVGMLMLLSCLIWWLIWFMWLQENSVMLISISNSSMKVSCSWVVMFNVVSVCFIVVFFGGGWFSWVCG